MTSLYFKYLYFGMVNWRAGLPRPMIRVLKCFGVSVFLLAALVIGNFLWVFLREMAEMTDGGRLMLMPKDHPYVVNSQLERHERPFSCLFQKFFVLAVHSGTLHTRVPKEKIPDDNSKKGG
eukprot:sb/3476080/